MRLLPLFVFLTLLAPFCLLHSAPPERENLELILDGVRPFPIGNSVPGILDLKPETCRPLLRNAEGETYAGIGIRGDGRVVAFAHGGFLKPNLLKGQEDARKLLSNVLAWAGKAKNPSIGLAPDVQDLAPFVKEMGYRVRVLEPAELAGQVDVFCFQGQRAMGADAIEAMQRFFHKGGGVVVAATPWAFGDKFEDFATFPPNQVAGLAGIRFQPKGTAAVRGMVQTILPDLKKPLHAAKALAEKNWKTDAERDSLLADLATGLQLTDGELLTFNQAVADLDQALGPIIPSLKKPVRPDKQPLETKIIELRNTLNQIVPPRSLLAIPAGSEYPGAVPPEAARVEKQLQLNATYKGWLTGRNAAAWNAKEQRPTGLYAAPGEAVTVTVPPEIVNAGYEVVIGAYRGGLQNRDLWRRYPNLQRSFPIRSTTTIAANGLGGLITIAIPQDAKLQEVSIGIQGAVEAPLYVHGETKLEDWKTTIRNHPGPWAELASERMIIAIPSSYVRDLENPDAVMEAWNAIIEKSAELVMVDRNNYRAERIVFERQTAAGYMHSGYPVAAPQDKSANLAVDAEQLLSEGNWGFFHEYGHNHQHNLWALPGTGETTCNLWSVYLFEELIGKDRDDTHRAVHPLTRRQRMQTYFGNGRKFQEEWSVWTALETYLQLQEAFGWEPFQTVFDEYNRLPKDAWPQNQQQRNDQWVLRFSRATGKNLVPFFEAWNLPLSDSVAVELADLPIWKDHPVADMVE